MRPWNHQRLISRKILAAEKAKIPTQWYVPFYNRAILPFIIKDFFWLWWTWKEWKKPQQLAKMAFVRSTYPMPKKRGTRAKKKKKRTNQNLIKFSFFRQKLLLLKRGKIGVRRSFLLLLIYLFLLSRDLIHLESSIYLLMSRLNFIISSLTSFALKVLPFFFLIVRRCYCYQIWWSKNSHKSTDYWNKHVE